MADSPPAGGPASPVAPTWGDAQTSLHGPRASALCCDPLASRGQMLHSSTQAGDAAAAVAGGKLGSSRHVQNSESRQIRKFCSPYHHAFMPTPVLHAVGPIASIAAAGHVQSDQEIAEFGTTCAVFIRFCDGSIVRLQCHHLRGACPLPHHCQRGARWCQVSEKYRFTVTKSRS